jgi:hypothetical protein
MKILNSIKNEEAGTEVYIFDRAAVDAKMPFGVRFLDTDADETITIIFCPTMVLAEKKMAELTKAPTMNWVSV